MRALAFATGFAVMAWLPVILTLKGFQAVAIAAISLLFCLMPIGFAFCFFNGAKLTNRED